MGDGKIHKKILFCASTASHIINFHNVYFDYLKDTGFEIHAAVGDSKSGDSGINQTDLIKSQKNFILTFEKSKKIYKNIKTIFKLSKIIRREKYDIISAHSMLAGFIARLSVILSGKKKIKVIHTCHGYLFDDDKSFKSRIMIFIEKFLGKRTDILFVMNGEDYKIAEKYKLCKNIIYTDGMGIDAKKLDKQNKSEIIEIAEKYKIPANKKYFMCVGEFTKRKNQGNIIRAFGRFIKNSPDNLHDSCHLIFLGGGVTLKECEKLCDTMGITQNVTFCGNVADVSGFYKNFAHFVISASRFEGLPFNIMEAFYYGVPVIASNVKGHKDLISDGVNGYLYKYNDDEELALLFEKVSDGDIYEKLKNNAFLDKKYYLDGVKEKILSCYRDIH